MTIDEKAFAVGLTGPFGSGCTTVANTLVNRLQYKKISLSAFIKEGWKKKCPKKEPTREELQNLGNQMRRETRNTGILAHKAIELLVSDSLQHREIVFDGIRNLGEIEVLKETFGRRFFLFALECPLSDRWERLQDVYTEVGLDIDAFTDDDERDREQEGDIFGQQVQPCVDQADVFLVNDVKVKRNALREKAVEYVQLVTGKTPRYAKPHEILMNLAYSAAHGSKCLKRQVGALLVTAPPYQMGDIVGQGFNDNPTGTPPCVEEPKYGANLEKNVLGKCYRDIVRFKALVQLSKAGKHCPHCGTKIQEPKTESPPWHCHECHMALDEIFWPERAMSLCTAIHAEVAAVLSAGRRAQGATLYTTTFPCFQCAEKIAQAGVGAVVFTEPYPDTRAAERLEIAEITVRRFEGIRSGRFDEIFSMARPYANKRGFSKKEN